MFCVCFDAWLCEKICITWFLCVEVVCVLSEITLGVLENILGVYSVYTGTRKKIKEINFK